MRLSNKTEIQFSCVLSFWSDYLTGKFLAEGSETIMRLIHSRILYLLF